jgi:IgA peptidase M64
MRGRRWMVALAAVVALVAMPAAAGAQSATVVPLQVTGPPQQRLNLVVLGDGYTAAEMPKFREQVDKHLNVQWAFEPFRSYRNYFNVYMIEVVSPVSGISCDPDDGNVRRDTPLRLEYAQTCPADPLARGITFGPGGMDALNGYVGMIPGVTPQNRQTLTLANTNTYGGIGGTNATTSGGNALGPLISPHELGHSLGGLQDEYPYSARGVPGGPYTGGEPTSIHHTLLTEDQMLAQQAKWWRWLGEESESGGTIGRYESGQSRSTGVWRSSEHSMMRWLGFYFDQVSRERMTQRISGRRGTNALALSSTPTDRPVGPNEVVWVETPHPLYHELDVTWRLNGEVVDQGTRNLEPAEHGAKAGDTIELTVQDPTAFVRDPAVRSSPAMTQTRQWTVGADPTPPAPIEAAFTASTQTDRAVGRSDVVWVETTHPVDRVPGVAWRLDGQVLPNPGNSRNLDLGDLDLHPGTYRLTATVGADTRTWTVDATGGQAPAALSQPLVRLSGRHNVYFEQFTMGLQPADDQPGYVVGEFRLDGDGWHHYYGWPDAPAGTPYLFTPTGTNIKQLIYGSLADGGVSRAPFEQRDPGYGTHTVEHRAVDAAGNLGAADEFQATVLPGRTPECTRTLTGDVNGLLIVRSGVTCLQDADARGAVIVQRGASLVASGGSIGGVLTAEGADTVQLFGTEVRGGARISGTTGDITAAGARFSGALVLSANDVGDYGVILAGNEVRGALSCTGNRPAVVDFGAANRVRGAATGDCRRL